MAPCPPDRLDRCRRQKGPELVSTGDGVVQGQCQGSPSAGFPPLLRPDPARKGPGAVKEEVLEGLGGPATQAGVGDSVPAHSRGFLAEEEGASEQEKVGVLPLGGHWGHVKPPVDPFPVDRGERRWTEGAVPGVLVFRYLVVVDPEDGEDVLGLE